MRLMVISLVIGVLGMSKQMNDTKRRTDKQDKSCEFYKLGNKRERRNKRKEGNNEGYKRNEG